MFPVIFFINIHDAQKINPNDSSEPMTFHLVPLAGHFSPHSTGAIPQHL